MALGLDKGLFEDPCDAGNQTFRGVGSFSILLGHRSFQQLIAVSPGFLVVFWKGSLERMGKFLELVSLVGQTERSTFGQDPFPEA